MEGGGKAGSRSTLRPCLPQDMFNSAADFDQDINAWDVGSATTLKQMFLGASAFNQSLNSWNVAKVTDMAGVFKTATLFSKEIGSWNTAKVTTMANMFEGAATFQQNLNDWDVGKVTTMNSMFKGAAVFNAPLSAWNVAKVADAASMFSTATATATLFNQDLSAWDVGTNNGAALDPVVANYGIVALAPGDATKFADMFKGTSMSNCNKKAIHNKFEASPRSLNVDFNGATEDENAVTQDWSFPDGC